MTDYKLVPVEPTGLTDEQIFSIAEPFGAFEFGDAQGDKTLAFARAILAAAPVQGEPVGWQYYQDGKWWNGDDRIKDHRKNTEEAGFRVRDVYAAPQPAGAALPPEITREMLGMIIDEVFGGGIEDASVIEDIYRVIARSSAPQPAEQQPDVAGLVEALERSVAGFVALSGMTSLGAGARNYARQKAIELNASLAACRQGGDA